MEPYSDIIQLPEECEIGVRKKDGKEYIFVLNYSKKTVEIVLKTAMTDMDLREIVEGKAVLEPYETKVYLKD